jgi:hypothetical protein
MAHDPNDRDMAGLDRLLADARDDAPPTDLMARVLSDAAQVQAGARAAPLADGPVRGGWLAGLLGAVGGWPALSGVVAAGITGVSLGFYAPDLVDSLSGGQIWSLSGGAGVTPDIGSLWAEAEDV